MNTTTIEKILSLENFNYVLTAARTCKALDSYENGQTTESKTRNVDFATVPFATLESAFRDTFNIGVTKQALATIDNNIYQDSKDGKTKVVDDRETRGVYRVYCDRQVTARGGKPDDQAIALWKENKLELFNVHYELEFKILVVGLDELRVAELIDVKNYS